MQTLHSYTFFMQEYFPLLIKSLACIKLDSESTINQISTFLEKTTEYGIEIHHTFVDFKSAYGTTKRKELLDAMHEFGIPNHLIELTVMIMKLAETTTTTKSHSNNFTPKPSRSKTRKKTEAVIF